MLDTLELELPCVLRIKAGSSGRAAALLASEPALRLYPLLFNITLGGAFVQKGSIPL